MGLRRPLPPRTEFRPLQMPCCEARRPRSYGPWWERRESESVMIGSLILQLLATSVCLIPIPDRDDDELLDAKPPPRSRAFGFRLEEPPHAEVGPGALVDLVVFWKDKAR